MKKDKFEECLIYSNICRVKKNRLYPPRHLVTKIVFVISTPFNELGQNSDFNFQLISTPFDDSCCFCHPRHLLHVNEETRIWRKMKKRKLKVGVQKFVCFGL